MPLTSRIIPGFPILPIPENFRQFPYFSYWFLLTHNNRGVQSGVGAALFGHGDSVEKQLAGSITHNLRRKIGKERIITVRGIGLFAEERVTA